MKNNLIIAYGNPLRRDDGIGWIVGEKLMESADSLNADIRIEHQLTPELAETISHYHHVILVDAGIEGVPGEVRTFPVRAKEDVSTQAFSHHFTPSSLLRMSALLFGVTPRLHLVTICGEDFGYGEGLSETVASRIPEILDAISLLLD